MSQVSSTDIRYKEYNGLRKDGAIMAVDPIVGASFSALAQSTEKQTFGAQVVSKTLEVLNQKGNSGQGANPDFEFQETVLSAALATGLGSKVNTIV